ncbi:Rrf2 family transcriptional regulator [Planctomicrobium sp. SH664]|uniref:Rrf2 family transcriptional regulator n=1 Tax=Planctomicrobium sp. SH664 TaxID=3448125 RepID=UPI003F5CAE0A
MLSKTAEYALRAIVCLAAPPLQPASADALARKTKVPRSYLNRVLQDLAAAGLLHSRPGPGGGHELARPPEEVTILDVVNAVAPIERIRKCPLGLASHTSLCPLHRQLDEAYATTEAAFRGVTLRDLLESTSSIIPLCEVEQDSSAVPLPS